MPGNVISTDPLVELAAHLQAIDELMVEPTVASLLGSGFPREFAYVVSGFRQRFPEIFESSEIQARSYLS